MDTMTIALPDQLNIRTARATRDQLLGDIRNWPGNVILEGGNVTHVDGAGVQLLLATLRELVSQDRSMQLEPSPAIRSALQHMGLERLFDFRPGAQA